MGEIDDGTVAGPTGALVRGLAITGPDAFRDRWATGMWNSDAG